MSRLLQLYEGYEGVFDDIVQRLRNDAGFKSLFRSCRTFHNAPLFLRKITTLKLLLHKDEELGHVVDQLATVPRGAHITKLTLKGDLNETLYTCPLLAFHRGILCHLSRWSPGMMLLQNITALEFQGIDFYSMIEGFGGMLLAALPRLQHVKVGSMSHGKRLLHELVDAGISLKTLEICCDGIAQARARVYFETLSKLTSLEALTLHTDCPYQEHHSTLAHLTNLTSFTWDIPWNGEYRLSDECFPAVLPSWHKLSDLSLFHCARRLPPVPVTTSLQHLHIQCLESDSLCDVHLLPKGLIFNVDMLILNCHDHGAMQVALTNFEQLLSAGVRTICSHLRLLCGQESERGSLGDVLSLLFRYSHVFVKAGIHQVSAMHVNVQPGEVARLAGLFDGISKLGLINYSLASLNVVVEAASLSSLKFLQLRPNHQSSRYASEVHAAGVAGHRRQQPLVIVFDFYPCDVDDDNRIDQKMSLSLGWDSAAEGVPAQVSFELMPLRFNCMPGLNDYFC